MKNELKQTIEDLDWDIYEDEDIIELHKYSPLGEDFFFTIENPHNDIDTMYEIRDYALEFDAEEHADLFINMRGTHGVPSSTKELLEDADDIRSMLLELADAMNDLILKYTLDEYES